MSPECRWNEVPPDKKEIVVFRLGGKKQLQRMLNGCEGFFITEELLPIEDCAFPPDLLEKNLRRARESDDFYHVLPLRNSKRAVNTREAREEMFADRTLENAEMTGYTKYYSGKHRTYNKGPGLRSLLTSQRRVTTRPRGLHKIK